MSEYQLTVNRIGQNKFEVKYIIEEEYIDILRESAEACKNDVSFVDKYKIEKEELEKELKELKSNYKSVIGKNASLTRELNKLKREKEG